MRILLVEDDPKVARFILKGLKEEGYAVDAARDGPAALEMIAAAPYDLIILDVMIPPPDGLEICRRLRAERITTPVLLLTARDALEDKVAGLDSGADDYLTKPFAFSELLARLRALLRRGARGLTPLRVLDLELDPAARRVMRGGRLIELTAREYTLLEYFLRHPNHVLTRTQITEHVWNYDSDPSTNVVDVYVNHLRRKIDRPGAAPLIHTVRGMGYVLKDDS